MFNKNDKQVNITLDAVTVWRVITFVVIAVIALMLLEKIMQPITLILISFFLAIALNPAVSWISRHLRSKSRIRATGLAYILVVTFIIGFISLVFPPLVRQTVDFIKDVPDTVQSLKDADTPLGSIVQRYGLSEQVDNLTEDFDVQFQDVGQAGLSTAGKIGQTLVSIIVVLVLTFMMLVEGPQWLERYFAILKPKHRAHHKKLAKKMYKVVVGYVNGQVVIAALGGIFTTITIFIASQILGVSVNAVALGGIIALFALLPMIGTIIGSIIVVLACLLVSWPLALIMAIFFIVYQQIENVTIQPYIQSRTNTLTPLLVLISALIGITLGGFLGALLAIPVAGCIKVVADDYFERKRNIKPLDQASVS